MKQIWLRQLACRVGKSQAAQSGSWYSSTSFHLLAPTGAPGVVAFKIYPVPSECPKLFYVEEPISKMKSVCPGDVDALKHV